MNRRYRFNNLGVLGSLIIQLLHTNLLHSEYTIFYPLQNYKLNYVTEGNPHYISLPVYTLNKDVTLTRYEQMVFASISTLEGRGHTISFAESSSPDSTFKLLKIHNNTTFRHVVFDNFHMNKIDFVGGVLNFDEQTYINVKEDQTWNRAFYFYGNTFITGHNHPTLTIAGTAINVKDGANLTISDVDIDLTPGKINVQDGGTLTISNSKITGVYSNASNNRRLDCLADEGTINLKNVSIYIAGDWRWGKGTLNCSGDVSIHKESGNGMMVLDNNAQSVNVLSDSKFTVTDDAYFYYERNVDATSFTFADNTSVLRLNGCTVDTSSAGMQLTKGTLVLSGTNILKSSGGGDDLTLGDGSDPANDFKLIDPADGVHFVIQSGSFNNNNVGIHQSITANTTLFADRPLPKNNMLQFDANTTFFGSGYNLIFPTSLLNSGIKISDGFTANFYNTVFQFFNDAHLNIGSGSSIIFKNNSEIKIYTDQTLTNTYIFADGTNYITGIGRPTIDLGTGSLEVAAGAYTLHISNVNLTGVHSNNFKCLNNSGIITLDNVSVDIPIEWDFSQGKLNIVNDAVFTKGIFRYTTDQVSTVAADSKLTFSNGMTFSYSPSNNDQNRLIFTDSSSVLSLDSCSLNIRSGGLFLKKGSLEISSKNYLESYAVGVGNGLLFGDGSLAANDFLLKKISSNAELIVTKGYIYDRNIQQASKFAIEQKILRYGDGVTFHHAIYDCYIGGFENQVGPTNLTDVNFANGGANGAQVFGRYDGLHNRVRFYLFDGSKVDRFGSNLGEPIKSGDYIKIEAYDPWTNITDAKYISGTWVPAPTSTPTPPYYRAAFISQAACAANHSRAHVTWRIYKKGAEVGDLILKGDVVYFYQYLNVNGLGQYSGYLGSSNLSYHQREIYDYHNTTGFPQDLSLMSNLDTELSWIVSDVYSGAYNTAHDATIPASYTQATLDSNLGFWPSIELCQV